MVRQTEGQQLSTQHDDNPPCQAERIAIRGAQTSSLPACSLRSLHTQNHVNHCERKPITRHPSPSCIAFHNPSNTRRMPCNSSLESIPQRSPSPSHTSSARDTNMLLHSHTYTHISVREARTHTSSDGSILLQKHERTITLFLYYTKYTGTSKEGTRKKRVATEDTHGEHIFVHQKERSDSPF